MKRFARRIGAASTLVAILLIGSAATAQPAFARDREVECAPRYCDVFGPGDFGNGSGYGWIHRIFMDAQAHWV